MKLKIDASSLATRRVLIVDDNGVKFTESSFTSGTRKFRFDQIECILLSPEYLLSFQVGREVFSLPTKADNPKHQEAIVTLVNQVRLANGEAAYE